MLLLSKAWQYTANILVASHNYMFTQVYIHVDRDNIQLLLLLLSTLLLLYRQWRLCHYEAYQHQII